jgi:hypothetical protein
MRFQYSRKKLIGTPFRRAILIALNVERDDFKKIYEVWVTVRAQHPAADVSQFAEANPRMRRPEQLPGPWILQFCVS